MQMKTNRIIKENKNELSANDDFLLNYEYKNMWKILVKNIED